MSIIPTAEEMEAVVRDAERYRWLRKRIEILHEEYLDGKSRPSFSIRIGCARVDESRDPGETYLSPERFEKECVELDAAIDTALTN